MVKNLRMTAAFFFLILSLIILTSCITDIWTGASVIYDRHRLYKSFNDYKLTVDANKALYKDAAFKCHECHLEVAVFNGDILLLGHLPTPQMRQEAYQRVATISNYRRLFNQISVSPLTNASIEDSLITGKIRGQMVADSNIDPHAFKVVTYDGIVYLMGNVIPSEADRVVDIARKCPGVSRVVKLFRYYKLTDKP